MKGIASDYRLARQDTMLKNVFEMGGRDKVMNRQKGLLKCESFFVFSHVAKGMSFVKLWRTWGVQDQGAGLYFGSQA